MSHIPSFRLPSFLPSFHLSLFLASVVLFVFAARGEDPRALDPRRVFSAGAAPRQSDFPDDRYTLGGMPLRNLRLRSDGGRPQLLESALYRRAESGPVALAWLLECHGAHSNAISAWANYGRVTPNEPLLMQRPGGATALVWARGGHIVSLEWRPATADALPAAATDELRVVIEPDPPRRRQAPVTRGPGAEPGDRFLPVPMIAQRSQGLCAPVTIERVLHYYGIPLRSAALEDLAESTPEAGANLQALLERLHGMRSLRLEIREVLGFDARRFQRVIARYNRAAARAGSPALEPGGPVLDLARIFAGADPELLRRAAAGRSGRRGFRRAVRRSIERGEPLLWGVVLGVVPEEGLGPRTRGGHLRLIVGYNARTDEVLYSDSWGPGHTLKRLPLDTARAITMTLHVPRLLEQNRSPFGATPL